MAITTHFAVTRVTADARPLFDEWGPVGRWTGRVTRVIKASVVAEAPVNKRMHKSGWNNLYPRGALKASIRGASHRTGSHGRNIVISANVPYAKFVHDGTNGPILPKHGKYLVLPETAIPMHVTAKRITQNGKRWRYERIDYGSVGRRLRKQVKGQDANPFIVRGYNFAAPLFPPLPPISQIVPHASTPQY